jgi:hypothetical protein
MITDEDIAQFNSHKEKLYLVYRGVCTLTSGYLLAITGEEESRATE